MIKEKTKLNEDKEALKLQKMQKRIEEIVHMVAGQMNKESSTPDQMHLLEFNEFTISIFINPLINFLSSPYFICLLLDKMFLRPFKLPDVKEESLTVKKETLDPVFSQEIGQLIYDISSEVFSMGAASGPMSALVEIVKKFMSLNKVRIGNEIQESLIKLCKSKCTITPIIALDAFLFKDEQGKKVPAITSYFDNTPLGIEAQKIHVYSRIHDKFYDTILQQVEQHATSPVRWLVENVDSLKLFCNNLTGNMYDFATQEETPHIMLTMISSVLKSAMEISRDPKVVKH